MIYCIDSQIFIWGIKKQCTAGQENMIEKAEYFFKRVDEEGHHILMPTIVIAEVLAPEPIEKYPFLMDVINRNFMVGEFNTMCAIRYANFLHKRFDDLKKFAHDNGIRKEKMKADFMVLATALAYNADILFTNDNGLLKVSQGYIKADNIPDLPEKQMELFD